MTEDEFRRRTDGLGFTLGEIAILRKNFGLALNNRDLPKGTEAERMEVFSRAVEKFAKTRGRNNNGHF